MHHEILVKLRQLDDGLQHVLLRAATGGVLEGGCVGKHAKQLHAGEMDVDRPSRDGQLRVGARHVGDYRARANRDVGLGEPGILLGDRRAQLALAPAGQLLLHREHVHVRVQRIDGVERPLPDLRFERWRCEETLLSRPLPRDVELRLQRCECRVALERFVNRA